MSTSIVDVWAENLCVEFERIRKIAAEYKYISMDTEFPGVVAKPLGNFASQSTFNYRQLQCNVNVLKIIQLGMTFANECGDVPTPSTWQFNFAFDVESDMCADESLALLFEASIDFRRHKEKGIDVRDFGALVMTSGIVTSRNVFWISFHSFYDFGYLLNILTGNPLPDDPDRFLDLLNLFFVNFYDLKHPIANTHYAKKGLQEIADLLSVKRVGIAHQAGSDSLLTLRIFFKLREVGTIDLENNLSANRLYGISGRQKANEDMEDGLV